MRASLMVVLAGWAVKVAEGSTQCRPLHTVEMTPPSTPPQHVKRTKGRTQQTGQTTVPVITISIHHGVGKKFSIWFLPGTPIPYRKLAAIERSGQSKRLGLSVPSVAWAVQTHHGNGGVVLGMEELHLLALLVTTRPAMRAPPRSLAVNCHRGWSPCCTPLTNSVCCHPPSIP